MSTTLATRTANAVKIGPDYFPVANLAEAVATWVACRDSNGWGASESPSVTACIDKKLYRISYNGRVWNPATDTEVKVGTTPTPPTPPRNTVSRFRQTPAAIQANCEAYHRGEISHADFAANQERLWAAENARTAAIDIGGAR